MPQALAADTESARMERRRAYRAGAAQKPLPGTPDTEKPLTRLMSLGVSLGAPVLIRIFKQESQFELWVAKEGTYALFATYPVCFWSGKLGPKLKEGDRQTPEGFYTITEDQLHSGRRWKRSLNIGYPNAFDSSHGRTGSAILIHGGCDSIGCFAMTDPVKSEIYDLVSWALRRGQTHVPVHVFPFRMTDGNLAHHANAKLQDFWADLQQGYKLFEERHLPPQLSVCGGRYRVEAGLPGPRRHQAVSMCQDDLLADAALVAARKWVYADVKPRTGARGRLAQSAPKAHNVRPWARARIAAGPKLLAAQ